MIPRLEVARPFARRPVLAGKTLHHALADAERLADLGIGLALVIHFAPRLAVPLLRTSTHFAPPMCGPRSLPNVLETFHPRSRRLARFSLGVARRRRSVSARRQGHHTMDSRPDSDDEARWMTYAEIAAARGISRASAERLVNRQKGRWRRQADNKGTVRFLVPLTVIPDTSADIHPDMSADSQGGRR